MQHADMVVSKRFHAPKIAIIGVKRLTVVQPLAWP
jgi:hypothetical protein